jgi:hypothetical protein
MWSKGAHRQRPPDQTESSPSERADGGKLHGWRGGREPTRAEAKIPRQPPLLAGVGGPWMRWIRRQDRRVREQLHRRVRRAQEDLRRAHDRREQGRPRRVGGGSWGGER